MPNATEFKGKVTKWIPEKQWGIVNYYPGSFNAEPSKAFLHASSVVSEEKPVLGSRVMFTLGAKRSETELPPAQNVRIIPSPAVI